MKTNTNVQLGTSEQVETNASLSDISPTGIVATLIGLTLRNAPDKATAANRRALMSDHAYKSSEPEPVCDGSRLGRGDPEHDEYAHSIGPDGKCRHCGYRVEEERD